MTKLKIGIAGTAILAALAIWLALQHEARVKEREAKLSPGRQAAPQAQAQGAGARSKAQPTEAQPTEAQEQEISANMAQGKMTIIALAKFARVHHGKLPGSLDELESTAPGTGIAGPNQTNATFELAYQGSFKALGALPNAREIIVLRQKDPLPYGDRWAKVYGYGDGHFDVRKQTDRDFTAWEQARTGTR